MNKRVKELAVKAGIISAEYNGFDATSLTPAQKTFAELIILECAGLTLDHPNPDYYQGWLDYRDEIRQHWGIEK
jgi:hypothetical protein